MTDHYVLQIIEEGRKTEKRFVLPKNGRPMPEISAFYPTTDYLPENLLRFYVQFSQPMRTVGNLENIKLINQKGEEVKGAIFNNVYELWDREQKQLTIILDPARIKSDLKVNKSHGRALVAGQHFQLRIDKVTDIYGRELSTPFVKDIFVQEEDLIAPDLGKWSIIAPQFGAETPLAIKFSQPVDRMSLYHRIKVLDASDKLINGEIKIEEEELVWSFKPIEKWEKGTYTIQINTRLEDPSGNNLNGLFDHKIGSLKNKQEEELVEMSFEVK